jgi:hypothetical protein
MAIIDLNPYEKKIYEDWLENKNKPSISPATAAKLFGLFVHGVSCQEICNLNAPAFCIEQVIEARVRDQWDEKRRAYTDDLYSGVVNNVRQTQVESIEFVSDLLAASHKLHGQKLKRFIQTGDETQLTGMTVDSFRTYKAVCETLLKLTGQDRASIEKRLPGADRPGVHIENAQILNLGQDSQVITPKLAGQVLAYLESKMPEEPDLEE